MSQLLGHLMTLAADDQAHVQVQAVASWKIKKLEDFFSATERSSQDEVKKAWCYAMQQQIESFRINPDQYKKPKSLSPPDGSPIGSDLHMYCDFGSH